MKTWQVFLFTLFIASISNAATSFFNTYGGGSSNECGEIITTKDSGFAICGTASVQSGGQTDFYLLKLDSAGGVIFTKTFGGGLVDHANAIVQLNDGGYIIAGYSNSFSSNNDYDGWVVRTDSIGNE